MKTTSKSTKSTKTVKTVAATAKPKTKTVVKPTTPLVIEDEQFSSEEMVMSPATSAGMGKKKYLFTVVALLIVAGLVGYKFKYYIIPAKVGNQPIFFWQYVGFMHQNYGKEALQRLTTQDLIEQEIARNKVTVKPEAIQHEVDLIDQQASSSGGINAMLAAQQMTMVQLRDQVRIQLAVKQILKDKIMVSETEITDAYVKNKDFFKGTSEADARVKVKEQLENQKFQTEAGTWLADIRKNTPITILFPGLQ